MNIADYFSIMKAPLATFNNFTFAFIFASFFGILPSCLSQASIQDCQSIFANTQQGELSPQSTVSEIIAAATGNPAEQSIGPAVYPKVYNYLSNPIIAKRLRRPVGQRTSNALNLKVQVEKFSALSDHQLLGQWRNSLLTLHVVDNANYWGAVKNLKRGDFVQVSRRVSMSHDDLAEFLQSGLVTSFFPHVLNYDSREVSDLFQTIGLGLRDRLQYNIGFGGLGISTTYRSDEWGKLADDQQFVSGTQAKALGGEDFVILLKFAVPVEALVLLDLNYNIPEHVSSSPMGFGFIQPYAAESEITFIDNIPSEWLTNLEELRTSFASFDKAR